MNQIKVLDKGYVRIADAMGSDLSVANAARASYAKESLEFKEKDARLVRFLAKNNHMSPFRHAFMTFEVKAPLMVARQWWKYVVGSDHTMDSWNEASRRYITMEPEFYIPSSTEWRTAPENSKQGSGEPLDAFQGTIISNLLDEVCKQGQASYEYALEHGAATEQARLMLPAYAMYTIWRWSASLQSVAFFLKQRLEDDAQVEIREYAKVVHKLAETRFPVSLEALLGE